MQYNANKCEEHNDFYIKVCLMKSTKYIFGCL